jgi:hypothetical protein
VSNTAEENERALQLMRKFLKAKTPLSTEIKFGPKPKRRR